MRNILRLALVALAALLMEYAAIGNIVSAQANPQPIAYGQAVTGQISTSQAENLYIFAASQGDSITIAMDRTDGNISPVVILVDQSQQVVLAVGNTNGDAANANARLRFVIPAQGNYVIRATTVQGSGDVKGGYKLTLTLDNPPATASAGPSSPLIAPLPADQPVSGNLSDSEQFHLYALHAKKGEPITASLDTSASDKLQAGMYLYTPDFREIARAELGQSLNIRAPENGVYFLMVGRAATSGAGTFTLRPNNAANSSTLAITPGQTVRSEITTEGAVKTYSLTGSANQAISVRMRRLSGNLSVYLYIVETDSGKTLAQANDSNGVADLSIVLPAPGTYAVVATRTGQQSGNTVGEFALSVSTPGQSTPLPPAFQNYTPIEYGDNPNGTIDDVTYAVPYVFSAQAGDTIQAMISPIDGSGDLQPYLLLQNVNGDTLAESHGKPTLQATLDQAGLYALIATRADFANGKSKGKYALKFDTVSVAEVNPNYGTLLIAGQAQPSGGGTPVGSLYRFEAQPDMSVAIDVSAGDAVTVLADGTFHQVAAATGAIRSTTLPQAGIYYVFVVRAGGPNAPALSSYTITLEGTVKPTPTLPPGVVVIGQPVTGKITNDVYQQRYTIEAKQGTNLIITLDAAPGSTLDPMVGLLDPKSNLLGVNDDAAKGLKNSKLIITIPKDGVYTIVVTRSQEAQGTTSGDYVLTVTAKALAPDILPIRYGGTVNGEITAQRFLYYYTFTGSAGDVITLRMSPVPGSNLDAVVYLYSYADGKPTLLASNNHETPDSPNAAIVQFKLPSSGVFLIAASRIGAAQGQSQGKFILTLNKDG